MKKGERNKPTRKGLVAGVIVVSLVPYDATRGRITLEEAVENKQLRQQYLSQIFSQGRFVYLTSVIYDPNQELLKVYMKKHDASSIDALKSEGHVSFTTPTVANPYEREKAGPTFARERVFARGTIQNDADMHEAMRHEEIHAETAFQGLKVGEYTVDAEFVSTYRISPELVVILGEIGAYGQQRLQLQQTLHSRSFLYDIDYQHKRYMQFLEEYKPRNPIEAILKNVARENK